MYVCAHCEGRFSPRAWTAADASIAATSVPAGPGAWLFGCWLDPAYGLGTRSAGATRRNEPMRNKYGLLIIGTGTAAMVAATRVRSAGWSVAVVDFWPFGGTCALRGCDPKKMMMGGADAADHAWRMKGHGIE